MLFRQVAMMRPIFTYSSVLGLVTILCACQSLPRHWKDDSQQKIMSELSEARDTDSLQKNGIPKSVTQALLPPINIDFPQEDNAATAPRFDLSVKNSRARDVYLGLVKDTPFSVVIDKDVSSRISLNLKDVSLEEALDAIRDTYGYEYERRGDKYYIYGNGLRSRIFNVNYINVNRVGGSTTNISSGGLTENTQNANVITKSEVDFWKTFKASMEAIIGKEEGRSVIVNSQSGLVVVTANSKELRLIEQFIRDTHDAIGRQVILEAKILEVELNDGFQAGINWGRIVNAAGHAISIGQTGGGTLAGVGTVSGLGNLSTNDLTASPLSSAGGGTNRSASGFGGMFSVALQKSNFGAFIEMIQAQGDVQVLSSPRVATVNNQKAVIKVGGDEFFITGVTSGQSDNSGSNNNQESGSSVELEAFFSGIALDVTPQIDKNGDIILHLHPTISEVAQRNKSFVVDGKSFNLPLAASTVRETDNIVRAESGQIIVVGGLMKESTIEQQSMVPVLGSIPFLGNLFKHQKVTRVKKELIVLVKPTVVNQGATWNTEAKNTLDRFAEIDR